MKKQSVFDYIISELMTEDTGTEQLDQCMQFNYQMSRKVPIRYKIIAIGFVRKYSLEQLNEKLQEYGCARLYARSIWEASLMYAFRKGLSYEEWKNIIMVVEDIREAAHSQTNLLDQSVFTMNDLEGYINACSDVSEKEILTAHLTMRMEKEISCISLQEELISYLRANIEAFSTVREKTRYYFCKYLYSYLEKKINRYLKISSRVIRERPQEIMEELAVFKGAGKVKKSRMSEEDIVRYLKNAKLSCGVIYAEFNEFFFDYISLDWMEVILREMGDIGFLSPKKKRKIINAAMHYDAAYKKMTDEEILADLQDKINEFEAKMDKTYSLDSNEREYQKNRMGENTIRKYLKGAIDLDRTTLICFLLFFGNDISSTDRLYINTERLSAILEECGFQGIDEYNDFDYFVVNYLESEEPADYLMEEVKKYAFIEQNFHFYKTYLSSRCESADLYGLISTT